MGLKFFTTAGSWTLFSVLKSDQNGIEIRLDLLLIFRISWLKSDQNGIEILEVYVSWEEVAC